MKKLILAVLFGLVAVPVFAGVDQFQQTSVYPIRDDVPLFSLANVQLAFGGSYEWTASAGDEAVPTVAREWTGGIYGAYTLSKDLALTGAITYGAETKFVRTVAGLRWTIFRGVE